MTLRKIYCTIFRKKLFTYYIDDIKYVLYIYEVDDKKEWIRNYKTYNAILEAKTKKKRSKDRLFSDALGMHEDKATWVDIKRMKELFQKGIKKKGYNYIKIQPYYDLPAKRMRLFDRMMLEAGYGLTQFELEKDTSMNAYGRIYRLATTWYTNKKEEFIDRRPYEEWLKTTLQKEIQIQK